MSHQPEKRARAETLLAEHGLMVAKDLAAKVEAARRALKPAFAAHAPDPVAARKGRVPAYETQRMGPAPSTIGSSLRSADGPPPAAARGR